MAPHIYRCFRCGAQSTDPDQFVNQRALMSNAETAMPEDLICDDSADCDANLALDTDEPPIPHCRAHPEFRSDCQACVTEREFAF